MTLQYSEISQVYPNWGNIDKINYCKHSLDTIKESIEEPIEEPIEELEDNLPRYLDIEIDDTFEVLKNLKENQKLRKIKNKLVIENRILVSIRRRMSGDSRNNLLEDLSKLSENLDNDRTKILINTLTLLKETTYKNDLKWTEKANELINKLKNSHP